ncbi:MAG: hypothetical protein ACMG6E_02815, partial [Candidatus Roizmanbacteria bacterium]
MDIKIKRLLSYCFGLLLLLLPVVMSSSTSELFEFNKMLIIYLISGTVLCLWVGRMILAKKIIAEKTILFWPILLLLLSYICSTLFSIDPHTSLYGYYGRFDGGFLSIVSYCILYFAFVSNLSDEEAVLRLLKVSLVTAVGVVLWALPGKFGFDLTCGLFTGHFNNACWTDSFRPTERIFSTLGQPNWLGAYLAIHIPLALYFVLEVLKRA